MSHLSQTRRRACRGIAVLEMAILLPLLLLILFGIAEFGSVFFVRQNMFHAAREAARGMAVGDLTSSEARSLASDRLTDIHATFTVNAVDADPGEYVEVEITTTIDEAALGDALNLFTNGSLLRAHVAMRKEES